MTGPTDAASKNPRCRRAVSLARSRVRTAVFRAALVVALVGPALAVPGVATAGADAPDGRIVFARDDGDSEIFAIDADGTRLRRLTSNGIDDLDPSWHPSGNKFAFVRHHPFLAADGRRRYNADIWTKSVVTGKLTRLTHSRYVSEYRPRYSPSGAWIAFQRNLGRTGDFDSQIVTIRPRDRATRVIASAADMDASFLSSPTWSPDGASIAYVVERGPPYHVAISDFDDGDVRVLSIEGEGSVCSEFESLGSLAWSPDGATLAYAAWPHVDSGALCLVPLDGGEPDTLIDVNPIPYPRSWAPQGGHLAGTVISRDGSSVVTIDVETGAIDHLTAGASPDWIVRPAE